MDTKDRVLKILLADDDDDDRFLFAIALREVAIPFTLQTVNNGVQLMEYLQTNQNNLPDVLVLDLNMPLKNGNECVTEIKGQASFDSLPIIIYSTSLREEIADILYANGAHYYIKKTDIASLKEPLTYVLARVHSRQMDRPERKDFILSAESVKSRKSNSSH